MEKMSCCINAYRPFTVITGTKSGPLYVYRGQRTISRSLFSAYTMWALGIKLKASGLEAKAFFFFAKLPCRTLTLIFKNEKEDRKKDAHGIEGAGGETEKHRIQVGWLYQKVS